MDLSRLSRLATLCHNCAFEASAPLELNHLHGLQIVPSSPNCNLWMGDRAMEVPCTIANSATSSSLPSEVSQKLTQLIKLQIVRRKALVIDPETEGPCSCSFQRLKTETYSDLLCQSAAVPTAHVPQNFDFLNPLSSQSAPLSSSVFASASSHSPALHHQTA